MGQQQRPTALQFLHNKLGDYVVSRQKAQITGLDVKTHLEHERAKANNYVTIAPGEHPITESWVGQGTQPVVLPIGPNESAEAVKQKAFEDYEKRSKNALRLSKVSSPDDMLLENPYLTGAYKDDFTEEIQQISEGLKSPLFSGFVDRSLLEEGGLEYATDEAAIRTRTLHNRTTAQLIDQRYGSPENRKNLIAATNLLSSVGGGLEYLEGSDQIVVNMPENAPEGARNAVKKALTSYREMAGREKGFIRYREIMMPGYMDQPEALRAVGAGMAYGSMMVGQGLRGTAQALLDIERAAFRAIGYDLPETGVDRYLEARSKEVSARMQKISEIEYKTGVNHLFQTASEQVPVMGSIALGGAAAAAPGAFLASYSLETGNMYQELKELEGVPEPVAAGSALFFGLPAAGLELIGFDAVLSGMGFKGVLRKEAKENITEAFKSSLKNAVTKVSKNRATRFGLGAIAETGTEVNQEIINVGAEEFAKKFSSEDLEGIEPREYFMRMHEIAQKAMTSTLLVMGAGRAVSSTVEALSEQGQKSIREEQLKKLDDLAGNDPYLYAKLLAGSTIGVNDGQTVSQVESSPKDRADSPSTPEDYSLDSLSAYRNDIAYVRGRATQKGAMVGALISTNPDGLLAGEQETIPIYMREGRLFAITVDGLVEVGDNVGRLNLQKDRIDETGQMQNADWRFMHMPGSEIIYNFDGQRFTINEGLTEIVGKEFKKNSNEQIKAQITDYDHIVTDFTQLTEDVLRGNYNSRQGMYDLRRKTRELAESAMQTATSPIAMGEAYDQQASLRLLADQIFLEGHKDRIADVIGKIEGSGESAAFLRKQLEEGKLPSALATELAEEYLARIKAMEASIKQGASLDAANTIGMMRRFLNEGLLFQRGDEVQGVEDIALIAQSLRDPRMEHLTYVVTDKTGKVLGYSVLTSGHEMSINIDGFNTNLVEDLKNLYPEAAHIYLTHNHPGGPAEFSEGDLNYIQNLRDRIETAGLQIEATFIATNFSRYAYNTAGEMVENITLDEDEVIESMGKLDLNAFMGREILNPEELVKFYKEAIERRNIGADQDGVVLVLNESDHVIVTQPFSFMRFMHDTLTERYSIRRDVRPVVKDADLMKGIKEELVALTRRTRVPYNKRMDPFKYILDNLDLPAVKRLRKKFLKEAVLLYTDDGNVPDGNLKIAVHAGMKKRHLILLEQLLTITDIDDAPMAVEIEVVDISEQDRRLIESAEARSSVDPTLFAQEIDPQDQTHVGTFYQAARKRGTREKFGSGLPAVFGEQYYPELLSLHRPDPRDLHEPSPLEVEALKRALEDQSFSSLGKRGAELFAALKHEDRLAYLRRRISSRNVKTYKHFQEHNPSRWNEKTPAYFGGWKPSEAEQAELQQLWDARNQKLEEEKRVYDQLKENFEKHKEEKKKQKKKEAKPDIDVGPKHLPISLDELFDMDVITFEEMAREEPELFDNLMGHLLGEQTFEELEMELNAVYPDSKLERDKYTFALAQKFGEFLLQMNKVTPQTTEQLTGFKRLLNEDSFGKKLLAMRSVIGNFFHGLISRPDGDFGPRAQAPDFKHFQHLMESKQGEASPFMLMHRAHIAYKSHLDTVLASFEKQLTCCHNNPELDELVYNALDNDSTPISLITPNNKNRDSIEVNVGGEKVTVTLEEVQDWVNKTREFYSSVIDKITNAKVAALAEKRDVLLSLARVATEITQKMELEAFNRKYKLDVKSYEELLFIEDGYMRRQREKGVKNPRSRLSTIRKELIDNDDSAVVNWNSMTVNQVSVFLHPDSGFENLGYRALNSALRTPAGNEGFLLRSLKILGKDITQLKAGILKKKGYITHIHELSENIISEMLANDMLLSTLWANKDAHDAFLNRRKGEGAAFRSFAASFIYYIDPSLRISYMHEAKERAFRLAQQEKNPSKRKRMLAWITSVGTGNSSTSPVGAFLKALGEELEPDRERRSTIQTLFDRQTTLHRALRGLLTITYMRTLNPVRVSALNISELAFTLMEVGALNTWSGITEAREDRARAKKAAEEGEDYVASTEAAQAGVIQTEFDVLLKNPELLEDIKAGRVTPRGKTEQGVRFAHEKWGSTIRYSDMRLRAATYHAYKKQAIKEIRRLKGEVTEADMSLIREFAAMQTNSLIGAFSARDVHANFQNVLGRGLLAIMRFTLNKLDRIVNTNVRLSGRAMLAPLRQATGRDTLIVDEMQDLIPEPPSAGLGDVFTQEEKDMRDRLAPRLAQFGVDQPVTKEAVQANLRKAILTGAGGAALQYEIIRLLYSFGPLGWLMGGDPDKEPWEQAQYYKNPYGIHIGTGISAFLAPIEALFEVGISYPTEVISSALTGQEISPYAQRDAVKAVRTLGESVLGPAAFMADDYIIPWYEQRLEQQRKRQQGLDMKPLSGMSGTISPPDFESDRVERPQSPLERGIRAVVGRDAIFEQILELISGPTELEEAVEASPQEEMPAEETPFERRQRIAREMAEDEDDE